MIFSIPKMNTSYDSVISHRIEHNQIFLKNFFVLQYGFVITIFIEFFTAYLFKKSSSFYYVPSLGSGEIILIPNFFLHPLPPLPPRDMTYI
jgi:hypothetical protein